MESLQESAGAENVVRAGVILGACGFKGGQRWWESHVEPLRDASGTIIGTIAVALDATERKRAEEVARRSQRQFEDLVNTIDGIVWEAEADTVDRKSVV